MNSCFFQFVESYLLRFTVEDSNFKSQLQWRNLFETTLLQITKFGEQRLSNSQ